MCHGLACRWSGRQPAMLPPPGRRWSFQLPPAHPKNPSQCLKLPIKGGGAIPSHHNHFKIVIFPTPRVGKFSDSSDTYVFID